LYLAALILCSQNLSQNNYMDCKTITIEGEELFFVGVKLLSMF
jgi:hypothetical protein